MFFVFELKDENFRIELYQAITIGTFVSVIYAFVQFLEIDEFTKKNMYHVSSFFEHKNVFSGFLFLSLPFAILYYLNSSKWWRYFSILSLILTLLFIGILQTRSIYFSMALSLLSSYLLYFKQINSFIKKKIILFSLALVMVLVLGISFKTWEKISISSLVKSESALERIKVWEKTIQLIKENPVLGVGPGNWKYQYMKFGVGDIESVAFSLVSFQKPHNDFLWILAENGLVGFLLFSSILIYVLVIFIKKRKLNLSNTAKICFIFLLGLLADSFFSFPREKISHIFLASILLTLLIIELNPKYYNFSEKRQQLARFGFIVAVSFTLVISLFRFKGEYYSMKLFHAKHENNYKELIDSGKKGISLFYKTNLTSIPLQSYMGYGYNNLRKYDSLLQVSQEAYLISPYSFEVLNNYGFILEKFHQSNEAKKILLESYRINPKYEMTLYNLVVLEFNIKNYTKSLFWLKKIPHFETKYNKTYERILRKIEL
ncbi:MAG: O-antigen ligase family protein [Bacteroidota bacterium]